MRKFKQTFERNVTVPRSSMRVGARGSTAVDPSPNFETETLPQLETTLKMLRQVENLQLEDLDFDSDDEDLKCGPPSLESNEHLYNNLISLDVKKPCPVKDRPRPVRPALKKDPLPDEKEYLTCELEPEHVYRHMITPEFPDKVCTIDDRSLYKKLRQWRT